ncbi:hypothetical protein [Streptomyces sp. NPDC047000]|uniref:hypothetical protein n=1 Tax=Streptomyces sp. NPDC047000 TaxID=3155474 RepID=UPI0033F58E6D
MSETLVTTTFVTTPAPALRSCRACSRRAYTRRRAVTVGSVTIGAAATAAGLAGVPDAAAAGATPACYGALVLLLGETAVRLQLRPCLRRQREVTVTMTDTEYRAQGPDRATSRAWTAFRSVSRVDGFWVLRTSPRSAMALPTAALDERQTAAFLELLGRKGLYTAPSA